MYVNDDGNATTTNCSNKDDGDMKKKQQSIQMARELFQWCYPVHTEPPPAFHAQNFISHMIEILLSNDPTFHPKMKLILKDNMKIELIKKKTRSAMLLESAFFFYIIFYSL
jgi:hypothetical protein